MFEWTAATVAGWLVWMVVSILPFLGSILVACVIPPIIGILAYPLLLIAIPLLIGGYIPGVAIGALQWLVLRKYIRKASFWLLATAIGSMINQLIQYRGWDAWPIESGMVIGSILGVCQALVLTRWKWQAASWVFASMGGWTFSWALFKSEGMIPAGIVLGVITGLTLLWLLNQPVRRPPRQSEEVRSPMQPTSTDVA